MIREQIRFTSTDVFIGETARRRAVDYADNNRKRYVDGVEFWAREYAMEQCSGHVVLTIGWYEATGLLGIPDSNQPKTL